MPDLRPLRVAQTTSQLLQAKHLKQQPLWLPTVSRIPPSSDISRKVLPTFGSAKTAKNRKVKRVFEPQRIKYIEDNLRQRFYKEHPWELARPVLLVENDGQDAAHHDWSKIMQKGKQLSGESVVQRQRYLMTTASPRLSRDKAYLQACSEFYAIRSHEAIETRIAMEEALAYGTKFDKSQVEVGLELESRVIADWREKALQAKSLVQPAASMAAVESSSRGEGAREETEDLDLVDSILGS
ncbi:37S ribosomal protein S25,mitochondrial [Taphrina deformans PYCC 5710]|uniref:Small ribosomal subunit protein mS23 n=1 Tax=Taphrina deformans (strain PYCC 5710 / ATCC 11124 / CBS 356.35 / IMI 108563 / JCM 9778 / NBRC 8474) TaxID=1097556 RepID=R4XDZ7_TAPDE|nr:37S ribosomal protein S25,mitochondrial [Taphrina deformans PYCC 5710]|eukprot:CCG82640.1 37S ribosomal protein S25,mitochondrial [Taphrina deformans PYCC 5710]